MLLSGFLPGLINGLIGTGGGILAVNSFRKQSYSQNHAHATAVALMLPLSAISLLVLLFREEVAPFSYWPFIFPSLAGSIVGVQILKHTKPRYLRILFTLLLLYSAFRILYS